MTRRKTLLACVPPDLRADGLSRYVANVSEFAAGTESAVHFLISSCLQELQVTAAPEFNNMIEPVIDLITEEWSFEKIDEIVRNFVCDLLIVPAGDVGIGIGSSAKIRHDLFERSTKPILILSSTTDLSKRPIESLLIPMSGEIRVSSALAFGLSIAKVIHVPVDLVHVIKTHCPKLSPLENVGDQPHHEYRDLLDRVLAEACPFSSTQERSQVRALHQVAGVPSAEILKIIKKCPSCALVSEWNGSLIHGKAETLKEILQQITMPVFLVKTQPDQKSLLVIGTETRVA